MLVVVGCGIEESVATIVIINAMIIISTADSMTRDRKRGVYHRCYHKWTRWRLVATLSL